MKRTIRKYFSFKGTAKRQEYWAIQLVVNLAAFLILAALGTFPIIQEYWAIQHVVNFVGFLIFASGVALPIIGVLFIFTGWLNLASITRRWRDADISLKWLWVLLIPLFIPYAFFVGWFLLGCLPSKNIGDGVHKGE